MWKIIAISWMISFVGFNAFADVEAVATLPAAAAPKIPLSMRKVNCAPLLTWLKSTDPMPDDRLQMQNDISATTDKIRKKTEAQGTLARRSYAEGNRIFEDLLQMLASNTDPTLIVGRIAKYINPVFDSTKRVVELAQEIHKASIDTTNPDFDLRANLKVSYVEESRKLGTAYSRYEMIMEALVSIASERGILDVGTVRSLPKTEGGSTPVIVYDLTHEDVVETARMVLEKLDKENSYKSLPKVEADTDDLDLLPYASLQVVQTVFRNNLYAILANREWSLKEQNYASRPWVWLTHFISDTGVNLTSAFPEKWRPFVRTVTGLGNTDSLMSRYLPDLLQIVGTTRAADEKGNMVITTDSYYLNLQIDRLLDSNASSSDDDELVTLARLLWHRKAWAAMVDELARQAGIQVGSSWLPKTLQDSTKPTPPKPTPKPGGDAKIASDDAPKHPATDTTPAAPAALTTNASQIAAYRLEHMLKAEQKAEDLGAIPFAAPRTTLVALRSAAIQLTALGVTGGNIAWYWPWIHDHIIQPILPFIH